MDQHDRQEQNGSVGSQKVLEKACRRRFEAAHKLRIQAEAEHSANSASCSVVRGSIRPA